MKVVKSKSSGWINNNAFVPGHFNWQEGYGAFAHSRSQRPAVIEYIMNQERHHRVKTFHDEYIGMLEAHDITYDERYLFEFYE